MKFIVALSVLVFFTISPARSDELDGQAMASSFSMLNDILGAKVESKTENGQRTVSLTLDRDKINGNLDKLQSLKLINPDVSQTAVSLHPNVISITMATEMIVMAIIVEYKNNPTDKCAFAANVLVADDYGQQKSMPIFSFGFDRALFNKINWSNFDDSNLAKVAYHYKMSPWAVAHFMD